MSTRDSRRAGSLQAKLDEALRQTGLSHRELARLILGAGAGQKEIENLRSQISKWRNIPGKGISAPNAARLSRGFGKGGLILPTDYFLPEPQPQENGLDDLRRRVEELEKRIAG